MFKHDSIESTQPTVKCLRCGSTETRVVREISFNQDARYVDARCSACGEQFVLKRPEPRAA